MKALTLRQPWAWLVTQGPKNIENRTWPLPEAMRNEVFLVHASSRFVRRDYVAAVELVERVAPQTTLPRPEELQLGGIVGATEVSGTVQISNGQVYENGVLSVHSDPKWWPWLMDGNHGFVLDVRISVPFVPCRGSLGFWTVPLDIAHQVFHAVREHAFSEGPKP